MKIKDDFIISEVGEDIVLVNVKSDGFKGIVRMNKTSKFIIDCLREDTTKEVILDKMEKQYGATRKKMAKSVDIVLSSLERVDALEE